LLKQTREKEETLHEALNQPLSFIQKALVDGLYTFYFYVLGRNPKSTRCGKTGTGNI